MYSDRGANVTQTEWNVQKQNPNNAKRRKPTDVYLPVAFTQDVDDTSLHPVCILCKILLQCTSGAFRVTKPFCNKIERNKNKLLNSVFPKLFFKAVISESTYQFEIEKWKRKWTYTFHANKLQHSTGRRSDRNRGNISNRVKLICFQYCWRKSCEKRSVSAVIQQHNIQNNPRLVANKLYELFLKMKLSELFTIQLDKSADIVKLAVAFVRHVYEDKYTEDLLFCKLSEAQATDEDIVWILDQLFKLTGTKVLIFCRQRKIHDGKNCNWSGSINSTPKKCTVGNEYESLIFMPDFFGCLLFSFWLMYKNWQNKW